MYMTPFSKLLCFHPHILGWKAIWLGFRLADTREETKRSHTPNGPTHWLSILCQQRWALPIPTRAQACFSGKSAGLERITGTEFNQPSPQQSRIFVRFRFNMIKILAQEPKSHINHTVNTIK